MARLIESGPTNTLGRALRAELVRRAAIATGPALPDLSARDRAPAGAKGRVSSGDEVDSSDGATAASGGLCSTPTASSSAASTDTPDAAMLHRCAPIRASGTTLYADNAGTSAKGSIAMAQSPTARAEMVMRLESVASDACAAQRA